MTGYDKPLPRVDDPVQAPFWKAAAQHRFALQECGTCGARRWPPAPLCPECLTTGGDWVEVESTGRIWSYAVYDHAYRSSFANDIPYNVAVVDLDAGPTMISNIVDAAPEDLRIGDCVTVVFDDITADVTLVKFAIAHGEADSAAGTERRP